MVWLWKFQTVVWFMVLNFALNQFLSLLCLIHFYVPVGRSRICEMRLFWSPQKPNLKQFWNHSWWSIFQSTVQGVQRVARLLPAWVDLEKGWEDLFLSCPRWCSFSMYWSLVDRIVPLHFSLCPCLRTECRPVHLVQTCSLLHVKIVDLLRRVVSKTVSEFTSFWYFWETLFWSLGIFKSGQSESKVNIKSS